MSASLYSAATSQDNTTGQPASSDFVIPSGAPLGSIAIFGLTRSVSTDDITTPTGWSVLAGPLTTASNLTSKIWAKKLVSGDPGSTVSFTAGAGARTTAAWTIVQGADLLSEVVITSSSAANTTSTMTAPTVTTVEANCFIATFFICRAAVTTNVNITPTGSQTEDAESNTNIATSPNFAMSIAHANSNSGAAGSYGGFTATTDQTMSHAHMYTIAVTSGSTYKKEQFLPFF